MSTAFVFPGQGSQEVGMGSDLLSQQPERLSGFYDRANQALGFDLQKLIFEGPADQLTLTQHAQPAILLDSVSKYELIKDRIEPSIGAGHSLGEYSALVCAGVLELEEALQLVHKRGLYMQEAVPVGAGGMVAILKLELDVVEEICRETEAEIANFNSPGQIVISGAKLNVLAAKDLAVERGGRGIELDVSAPFHSTLMQPAEERLSEDIDKISFKSASFAVISTVSGKPESDSKQIKELLKRQITAQVRWPDYVDEMKAWGASKLIEVGPGEVLTRLNKRINKELESVNFAALYES